jgi:hypothetical protein
MSRQDRKTHSPAFPGIFSQITFCTAVTIILGLLVFGGCSPRSLFDSEPEPPQADAAAKSSATQTPPVLLADTEKPAQPIGAPDLLSPNPSDEPADRPSSTKKNPKIAIGDPPMSSSESLPSSGDSRTSSEPLKKTSPLPMVPSEPAPSPPQAKRLTEGVDTDQTPEDFIERIRAANEETQKISQGRAEASDVPTRERLIEVLEVKSKAARRLAQDTQASPGQALVGRRSEIEALSGLAALGGRNASQQLQSAATQAMDSGIGPLVNDGRTVLIAMAVEKLVRGDNEVVTEILDLAKPFASPVPEVVAGGDSIPILMTLGNAREQLNQYGHGEAADDVRQIIIDGFASSSNPNVANLAAEMAGNVVHNQVAQLRDKVIQGGMVDLKLWRESIESLIDEAPDLQTVRYLAPLASELESYDQNDIADIIYKVLEERFTDPMSAAAKEAMFAIELASNRRQMIGQMYEPQLPALDKSTLSLADYRGRVVLMPFLACSSPESMSIVSFLEELQKSDPKSIAIVGMNLQPDQAAGDPKLPFASFAATGGGRNGGSNPVAIEFGVVMMPCVAVIDTKGRVAGICLRPEQIKKLVKELRESAE